MGEWECAVCGHIHTGDEPPATCPDCGAAKDRFEYYSYDDDGVWLEEELADDDEFDEDFADLPDVEDDGNG